MESVSIIAEVLDKFGKVHERIKLAHFPALIGRSYDCDVILSDEFISPHHLQISLDDAGQPTLNDLGSENGTYLLPKNQAVQQVALGGEMLLQIGHTLIRLRRPEFPLAPTRMVIVFT